jgi:hypothetical protein
MNMMKKVSITNAHPYHVLAQQICHTITRHAHKDPRIMTIMMMIWLVASIDVRSYIDAR